MADDRDTPTPRVSSSYQVFHDEAVRLARALREAAVLKTSPHRPDAYDRPGASRARHLAVDLEAIAARFALWPTAHPETVAVERAELTPRLMKLQREALELLAATPKSLPPMT